ncbi:phage major capsid protein [Bacillus mycoides]|uniref:SU10 major capsid protein n=1 Tax=Bacillus mycoides TaxID=1405 RepID=UPI001C022C77|nr:DUF5309 family protein [Bacillus mycoides]QWG74985.1 phage major capsid protein [Bacillus mycoides]QWH24240.1 phage major capsid protein [Bacillus mycoides]
MLDSKKLTAQENIHLTDEIALVAPKATPLMSLLMSKGLYVDSKGKFHTWREKTLDGTADITVDEGVDVSTFVQSARAELNNVMEIFLKATSVSGTAQATGKVGDLFAQEINDRLSELAIGIEKKLINGVKNDGASGKRQMDGLLKFVDVGNVVNGTTLNVVTEKEIKSLARKLFDAGNENGEFYALVSADIKDQIDDLYKGNYNYNHVTNDFGIVVNSIETSYGTLNFVLDRFMPADKIVAFDVNALKVVFLRQPQFKALGKTGDNDKGQVVAEASLEVGSKKAVAVYNLKTS